MTDIAYKVVSKKRKGVDFSIVWSEIINTLGFDESMQERKIAEFYTDLMLDKRFISLEDNRWDIRARHAFSNEVIEPIDLDDDEDDFEEDKDEDEDDED